MAMFFSRAILTPLTFPAASLLSVPVAILTQIFSLKVEGYSVTSIKMMKLLLHFEK